MNQISKFTIDAINDKLEKLNNELDWCESWVLKIKDSASSEDVEWGKFIIEANKELINILNNDLELINKYNESSKTSI